MRLNTPISRSSNQAFATMSTHSIDLHTRLRAATAPLHNHLNQQPMLAALLGHDIPLADYQSLLGTYYCFKFHMQTYSFESLSVDRSCNLQLES